MSFFNSKTKRLKKRSAMKLPHRKLKSKLKKRGSTRRRLKLLRQFKVGTIYTFPEFRELEFNAVCEGRKIIADDFLEKCNADIRC